MRAGWNGADPDPVPRLRSFDVVRLILRAIAAGLWTTVLFGAFLVARGTDLGVRAILLRRLPALAPWVVQAWAIGALALLGLRLDRRGSPMDHPGALVANHAGWLDVVVLMRATRVFFVSKSDVARWPVIGFIARRVGVMFIERRPVEARRQSQILHARVSRGDRLCIFPEGTSTDGQRVLPFKSALFGVFLAPDLRDALWVQPVRLDYVPASRLPRTFYAWWGDTAFGAHLAQVLALSHGGVVTATFHPPLRCSDFHDRKALAQCAETAVRAGA